MLLKLLYEKDDQPIEEKLNSTIDNHKKFITLPSSSNAWQTYKPYDRILTRSPKKNNFQEMNEKTSPTRKEFNFRHKFEFEKNIKPTNIKERIQITKIDREKPEKGNSNNIISSLPQKNGPDYDLSIFQFQKVEQKPSIDKKPIKNKFRPRTATNFLNRSINLNINQFTEEKVNNFLSESLKVKKLDMITFSSEQKKGERPETSGIEFSKNKNQSRDASTNTSRVNLRDSFTQEVQKNIIKHNLTLSPIKDKNIIDFHKIGEIQSKQAQIFLKNKPQISSKTQNNPNKNAQINVSLPIIHSTNSLVNGNGVKIVILEKDNPVKENNNRKLDRFETFEDNFIDDKLRTADMNMDFRRSLHNNFIPFDTDDRTINNKTKTKKRRPKSAANYKWASNTFVNKMSKDSKLEKKDYSPIKYEELVKSNEHVLSNSVDKKRNIRQNSLFDNSFNQTSAAKNSSNLCMTNLSTTLPATIKTFNSSRLMQTEDASITYPFFEEEKEISSFLPKSLNFIEIINPETFQKEYLEKDPEIFQKEENESIQNRNLLSKQMKINKKLNESNSIIMEDYRDQCLYELYQEEMQKEKEIKNIEQIKLVSTVTFDIDAKLHEKIEKKNEIINKKLDETGDRYLDIFDLSQEEKKCGIRPDKLTQFELEAFKNLIKKPMDQRDLEKIDNLLINLKFFHKLEKRIRMDIIKYSQHMHIPKGNIIFNEGDFGDLMYIIIKGSVEIRKNYSFKQSVETVGVSINSLYDGYHFGELAMLGTKTTKNQSLDNQLKSLSEIPGELDEIAKLSDKEKIIFMARKERIDRIAAGIRNDPSPVKLKQNNTPSVEMDFISKENSSHAVIYVERIKRSATAQTSGATDLLALSRDKFKEIMLSMLQKDIDEKVSILLRIPFLRVICLISKIT